MSLNSNALITLNNLKLSLEESVNENAYDQVFEMLINAASTLIINEVREDLVYTTYANKKMSGNGLTVLRIANRPIVTLTELIEADITLTEDTDFYVHYSSGYLEKADGAVWAKGIKNIDLSYKAGYWVVEQADTEDSMPADIQQACRVQVGFWWKENLREDWGEISRTFPDGSTSRIISALESGLTKSVKDILKYYGNRPIV